MTLRTAEKTSDRIDSFVANPRRGLWTMAMPMMAGMSLQTIYMIVDMIFVGRISPDALAALAFNLPVVFLGMGVTFGLGTGITAVIAQSLGARQKERADRCAQNALLLGALLTVALTTVGVIWGKPLLGALGVPAGLMAPAHEYFQIIVFGFVFMVASVFFRSVLSGEGDMKTPMMIQGTAVLLNIVLDPIFIFGLGLGVRGAALATVLAQATAAAIFAYLLLVRRSTYVSLRGTPFRLDTGLLGDVVRLGAPASFSFLVMSLGGGMFNRILIEYSPEAVAAFQVGSRLDHVVLLPMISVSASLVTLVGMFAGAARLDLVDGIVRYALSRTILLGVVIGVLFFLLAPQLVTVFSESEEIRRAGVSYLRIVAFSYPFVAVSMLTGRVLQGLGQGMPMLLFTTMRVLLVAIPLAMLFVFVLELPLLFVWAAIVAGVVATSMVAALWLRHRLRHLQSLAAVNDRDPTPAAEPARA